MLEVFKPLELPHDFCQSRIRKMEETCGKYGVIIKCRWWGRCNLVTNQIEKLQRPLKQPVIEDFQHLILKLGSPEIAGPYGEAIRGFTKRVFEFMRESDKSIERLEGDFGRVHFAPAYFTKTLCGKKGVYGDSTCRDVTCWQCAAEALRLLASQNQHPYVLPQLRQSEINLGTRPAKQKSA